MIKLGTYSLGILLLPFFSYCALYHRPIDKPILFEAEKEDVNITVEIDTTNWLSTVIITNLSDTTAYIYPRFTDATSTSIYNSKIKTLILNNFANYSSIEFPVHLIPIKPNSSVSVDLSLDFSKGNVNHFNDFSEIYVSTNLMKDFSRIDTFSQIQDDGRKISSMQYDRYSIFTQLKFNTSW